jgi:hypothetical protein
MRNDRPKKVAVFILKRFMVLGAVGYVTSLVVHIIALTKLTPVNQFLVIGLIAGVFATTIPTVIMANAVILRRGLLGYGRKVARQRREALFGNIPPWLRWLLNLTGIYTAFNFILTVVLIETSSAPDHNLHPQNFLAIRMLTGHAMAFYASTFAMLYSKIVVPPSEDEEEV